MASTPVGLLVEIGEQLDLADLGHVSLRCSKSECDAMWWAIIIGSSIFAKLKGMRLWYAGSRGNDSDPTIMDAHWPVASAEADIRCKCKSGPEERPL